MPNAAEWIRFDFAVIEPVDSALPADEERALVVFPQGFDAEHFARQRVQFSRTGFPQPQPAHRAHPDITLTVFIEAEGSRAKPCILSLTIGHATAQPADLTDQRVSSADPYRTFAILQDSDDVRNRQLWILL